MFGRAGQLVGVVPRHPRAGAVPHLVVPERGRSGNHHNEEAKVEQSIGEQASWPRPPPHRLDTAASPPPWERGRGGGGDTGGGGLAEQNGNHLITAPLPTGPSTGRGPWRHA